MYVYKFCILTTFVHILNTHTIYYVYKFCILTTFIKYKIYIFNNFFFFLEYSFRVNNIEFSVIKHLFGKTVEKHMCMLYLTSSTPPPHHKLQ